MVVEDPGRDPGRSGLGAAWAASGGIRARIVLVEDSSCFS